MPFIQEKGLIGEKFDANGGDRPHRPPVESATCWRLSFTHCWFAARNDW